jgi:hypothetical protein
MHTYRILRHLSGTLEAVKDGFSWPAFFFGFIWACSKRLWGPAVLLFLIFFFITGASLRHGGYERMGDETAESPEMAIAAVTRARESAMINGQPRGASNRGTAELSAEAPRVAATDRSRANASEDLSAGKPPGLWYTVEHGEQAGPWSLTTLRARAREGLVSSDTLVWTSGMDDWAPLHAAAGVR